MKKAFFTILLAVGFILPSAGLIYACDYCLLSQGISPLETLKGSGIRINERYTRLDKVYAGTKKITLNPAPKEEFWTAELTGFYSLTGDMTVLGVIPFRQTRLDGHIHRHADGDIEVHSDMKGKEDGLGDIALVGRYTFARKHTLDSTASAAALAGVKFPTGKTKGRTSDGAEFLDAHVQPGTGSYDYLIGVSANYSLQRFSIAANLLGTVTTWGKAGDIDHRFGNALNYDLTGRYRVYPAAIGPAGPQIFAAIGIIGELRDREKENGVKVRDSGGNTAYIAPGLQAVFAPHWVLELSYQQAVYHHLYGTQLGEGYKANAGVTYLF